jgi:Ca-activated chloride channel family protein
VHDGAGSAGEVAAQRVAAKFLLSVRCFQLIVKRLFLAILFVATAANAQTVRITHKPETLVHGTLTVPIVADEPVAKLALFINGAKYTEAPGRVLNAQVRITDYIRRLRMRAVGYDAQGNIAGEDEMVVNDPRPPFRVKLSASPHALSANVTNPIETQVAAVDFYIGEEKIGSVATKPYAIEFDPAKYPNIVYARVVARALNGEEANDVVFYGDRPSSSLDVTLQQIPVSVASGTTPLRSEDLTLIDDGEPRKIESLVPASELPLYVVLLVDYSESMLEELPVVKAAAKQFGQRLLRPQDRIAIVGFNQRIFWLTAFTNDWNAASAAVDRVQPIGETHLYDSAIQVLYDLQKMPGRHALVILTDGVDQGSAFKLEHLTHYARYAGVPIYPIVKNKMLSKLMRFGIGQLQARRLGGIARDTGATYFIIQREAELPGIYQRIADELRQQYQLLFYSGARTSEQWHTLKVETSGGQSLRVPKGYFP